MGCPYSDLWAEGCCCSLILPCCIYLVWPITAWLSLMRPLLFQTTYTIYVGWLESLHLGSEPIQRRAIWTAFAIDCFIVQPFCLYHWKRPFWVGDRVRIVGSSVFTLACHWCRRILSPVLASVRLSVSPSVHPEQHLPWSILLWTMAMHDQFFCVPRNFLGKFLGIDLEQVWGKMLLL